MKPAFLTPILMTLVGTSLLHAETADQLNAAAASQDLSAAITNQTSAQTQRKDARIEQTAIDDNKTAVRDERTAARRDAVAVHRDSIAIRLDSDALAKDDVRLVQAEAAGNTTAITRDDRHIASDTAGLAASLASDANAASREAADKAAERRAEGSIVVERDQRDRDRVDAAADHRRALGDEAAAARATNAIGTDGNLTQAEARDVRSLERDLGASAAAVVAAGHTGEADQQLATSVVHDQTSVEREAASEERLAIADERERRAAHRNHRK